ncbi:hypothetical protein JCM8547_006972 [Rhodosporidiobolus lusitaniae]
MRPSSRSLVRAVPLSSIPPHALRLPPKPSPSSPSSSARASRNSTASPTIDRLLKSFPSRGLPSVAQAGARAGEVERTPAQAQAQAQQQELPPNLRINEFVPKRREYEGVRASHRDLLKKLRREA